MVEASGQLEGATFPSDTRRIADAHTMPGDEAAPRRGAAAAHRARAVAGARTRAPRCDAPQARTATPRCSSTRWSQPLPVGLDQSGQPVLADFAFVNGEKGGHVYISGISGVATKTSYALFLLYLLFETALGRGCSASTPTNTRALVFNVKGEDLLHIDRPNALRADEDAARSGHALGVPEPGPFRRSVSTRRGPRADAKVARADVVRGRTTMW